MPDLANCRQEFLNNLVNQDIVGGMAVIESAIQSGAPPETILLQVVNSAMDEVGRRQAKRAITLSEIYVIARISDNAIDRLLPLLPYKPTSSGKVVIGTIRGDYHGLGRKLVSSFLRAAGFEVIDLGLSVSPSAFVDTAVEWNAHVICVSALLLHTAQGVKEVRSILHEKQLEDRIKLVVGGAALNFDRRLYREIGADATARNASDAVQVVRLLMEAAK